MIIGRYIPWLYFKMLAWLFWDVRVGSSVSGWGLLLTSWDCIMRWYTAGWYSQVYLYEAIAYEPYRLQHFDELKSEFMCWTLELLSIYVSCRSLHVNCVASQNNVVTCTHTVHGWIKVAICDGFDVVGCRHSVTLKTYLHGDLLKITYAAIVCRIL